jgi:antitoxin ParD1/3/4
MNSIQISLPDAASRFVEEQVATGKYGSPADVVLDIVERARMQAAKEKLTQLIREGMESGPGTEYSDEWWERRGREIRAKAQSSERP